MLRRFMAPLTHLLTSWVIGATLTDNPRDCRLVTLAGVLPDLDGLGLAVDLFNRFVRHHPTNYYQYYHHYLLHGAFGAVVVTLLLTCLARSYWRVAVLSCGLFHLHLLCDLVGSRGPSPEDLWAIFYYGPFDKDPMWIWKGQWPLDAWRNRLLTLAVFIPALWLPPRLGYSVVGVFSRKADRVFVETLRGWRAKLEQRFLKVRT